MKSRSGSPQSICSYRRAYDARFAVLTRERRFWDRADRETSLRSRGVLSIGRMHVAALGRTLVADNWPVPLISANGVQSAVSRARFASMETVWKRTGRQSIDESFGR